MKKWTRCLILILFCGLCTFLPFSLSVHAEKGMTEDGYEYEYSVRSQTVTILKYHETGASSVPEWDPSNPDDFFMSIEEGETSSSGEQSLGEGYTLQVPDTIDGMVVDGIGNYAFAELNAERIELPASIKTIGDGAFCRSKKLSHVDLPEGIVSMGRAVFKECESLSFIELPDGIPYISQEVFCDCKNLRFVSIPDHVTRIYNDAFAGCSSLTELTLPNDLTAIYPGAFKNCTALQEIEIPESTGYIYEYAFSGCSNLAHVKFGSELQRIFNSAFENCKSLTSIYLPAGVRSVEGKTFYNCVNLEEVFLPSSVTTLEDAFVNCYKLSTLEIPYSVKNISAHAFGYDQLQSGYKLANEITMICHEGTAGHRYAQERNIDCIVKSHSFETLVTKADMALNGSIVQQCKVCGFVKSREKIYSPKTMETTETSYTYTGKKIIPKLVVKDRNGNVIPEQYYKIRQISKCIGVKTHEISIIMQGKYFGSRILKFDIVPKKTSISKLTPEKKGLTVKWKKVKKEITGYQVQVARNMSFTGKLQQFNVDKSKTKKKVSHLKAKTRYYVRVRAYKKSGIKKYWSKWSDVELVKTK